MKIISHRGNINGSITEKENRPSYIDTAIKLGYDVEIDIRYLNQEFWLGHDEPQYKVTIDWLKLRKNNLWLHCKNKESASELLKTNYLFNFFCHFNDDFVLTSTGHLWVHNLKCCIDKTTIIPLLSLEDINNYEGDEPFGVCSDYVIKLIK